MASDELPDVILMDVVMPSINGFQATRQVTRNEITSHIPVVIVSSKDQYADKIWGEREGACGYLTKPIDGRKLINMVNGLLAELRDKYGHRCIKHTLRYKGDNV
jgi:twitching motility two-component system response regulator PilH